MLTAKQIMRVRKAMPKALGVILWRGKSLFNGKPLMVVLRFSGNTKTGARDGHGGMHTVYIVNDDDFTFNESRRNGCDDGNCGDCDMRGIWDAILGRVVDRLCYVDGRGLHGLYDSIQRGNYPYISDVADASGVFIGDLVDHLSPITQPLRLGGWGDAALVPHTIWEALRAEERPQTTNYTHQWRWLEIHQSGYSHHCAYMKSIAMASCHRPRDVIDADKLGWRKFTTVPPLASIAEELNVSRPRYVAKLVAATLRRLKGDRPTIWIDARCPADPSLPSTITCDICPITCSGFKTDEWGPMARAGSPKAADVWIPIHGAPSVIAAWKRSPFWREWMIEFAITQKLLKEKAA